MVKYYGKEVHDTLQKYVDNGDLLENESEIKSFKEFLKNHFGVHTVENADPFDIEKTFFNWQVDDYCVTIIGRMYGLSSLDNLKEDNPKEFKRVRKLILDSQSKGNIKISDIHMRNGVTFDIQKNKVSRQYWLGYKDEEGQTEDGRYWDDYQDYPENIIRLIDEADAGDIIVTKD